MGRNQWPLTELLPGLQRQDIDHDAATLPVNRGLASVSYETHASRGKTSNSRRAIDLAPRPSRCSRHGVTGNRQSKPSSVPYRSTGCSPTMSADRPSPLDLTNIREDRETIRRRDDPAPRHSPHPLHLAHRSRVTGQGDQCPSSQAESSGTGEASPDSKLRPSGHESDALHPGMLLSSQASPSQDPTSTNGEGPSCRTDRFRNCGPLAEFGGAQPAVVE